MTGHMALTQTARLTSWAALRRALVLVTTAVGIALTVVLLPSSAWADTTTPTDTATTTATPTDTATSTPTDSATSSPSSSATPSETPSSPTSSAGLSSVPLSDDGSSVAVSLPEDVTVGLFFALGLSVFLSAAALFLSLGAR